MLSSTMRRLLAKLPSGTKLDGKGINPVVSWNKNVPIAIVVCVYILVSTVLELEVNPFVLTLI